MSRKLTVKRLRASDLTFFEFFFRKYPETKQKAFNLDQRVIEREFFPSLTEVVESLPEQRALVMLTFFGPGKKPAHSLARKVLKQQKNWRLNGELFPCPPDDPHRYDVIAPDDFAVMEFIGTAAPTAVRAALIAAADVDDAPIHRVLETLMGQASMRVITEEDLQRVLRDASADPDHPLQDWIESDLLEQIAVGSGEAAETLNRRRRGRGMSASELQRAQLSAERTGRLGEEILNYHLENDSTVREFVWASQVNAVSPFDFSLVTTIGEARWLDAKSTAGSFSNPLHLSLAELRWALQSGQPYDIYRLYEVEDGGAKLRIAKGVGTRLAALQDSLDTLPAGVTPDSFTIHPEFLNFDPVEISIRLPDDSTAGSS